MVNFSKTVWVLFLVGIVIAVISISLTKPHAEINDGALLSKTRPDVDFFDLYHDSHMENFECLDCHHKYINGKNVLDEDDLEEGNPNILCSSCHNGKSKIRFSRAFHRECIGCHDRLSAKGEKTGPSLCGECHIRQKVEAGRLVNGVKMGDKNG